ncbi:MAG: hypothetical protein HQM12_13030 [SAR324 cluster bacterium]|nr:hypothetical protein [SAR324 cluster bacterium]
MKVSGTKTKWIIVFGIFFMATINACSESDTCGDLDLTCINAPKRTALNAKLKIEPSTLAVNQEFLVDASATTGADKVIIRIEGNQICANTTGCFYSLSEKGVYKITVKAIAYINDGAETSEDTGYVNVIYDY